MAQFHVYENQSKASRKAYPYLLDIQSNLLDELRTTAVVPLSPFSQSAKAAITRLTPVVSFQGKSWVVLTPQIAGVDRNHVGKLVADLTPYRGEIVAALDFLISGI
jgi:toxin CcdB